MASNRASTNANSTASKRMSTPASSASITSASSSASTTKPIVNPDKAMCRLLYAVLKQKSLKDIDWDKVASDPALLEGITNGHAARMRYSRFRNTVDNSTSGKRPKGNGSAGSNKPSKVVKRKSIGPRHVERTDKEDEDADGDTEVDEEYGMDRTLDNRMDKRMGKAKMAKISQAKDSEKKMKIPKEDPDIMDALASVSFSSLPSPPMEAEAGVDFGCMESPLIPQNLFQVPSYPAAVPSNSNANNSDRLVVPKKRKAHMHSPNMSMDMALDQIPQVPYQGHSHAHAQAQHRQIHGYVPDMNVGLGLTARIHSMPLLHQHQQQHLAYTGSALMVRHHSAGSHGVDMNQAHHLPQQNMLARTRLLTPSSDDLLQKQMPAHFDEYLGFQQSANDTTTPHTQWTTPFASPLLEDSLDAGLDMSPYIGGVDFSAAPVSVATNMEPMMSLVDGSTSLFAMVEEPQAQTQPQPQAPSQGQAYMAAFAKHSSGRDAMISQRHV